jgi:3'(2'), 5'-bisphosphate nucleotidase
LKFTDTEIQSLLNIIRLASEAIIEVYATGFNVEIKNDQSPLTIADIKSNDILNAGIRNLFPDIPIISEENKHIEINDRKHYKYFWLIDPLDGTKEFIKRNGEFTINVALVENNIPIYGIIAQPTTGKMWHNLYGHVVMLIDKNNETPLQHLSKEMADNKIQVIASRSHLNEETERLTQQLISLGFNINIINAGSALKFCLICENKAHIYPRLAPTMEWDTAAGQALINSCGGIILDTSTKNPLLYNKISLLNPSFIAFHPALNHLSKQLM